MTVERAVAADWDSLECEPVTTMKSEEPGGTLMVFLHGYGGTGAGYTRFAKRWGNSRVRVCLPESPLLHAHSGGRMWWEFLEEDWPQYFRDEPAWDANSRPSRQLAAASAGIAKMIGRLRTRYKPERVVVAGHSQGAMLAMDVAAMPSVHADTAVLVAGGLLIDSVKKLAHARSDRPQAFLFHSRNDPLVPYSEAERATKVLRKLGLTVSFRSFNDGHALSAPMVGEIERIANGPGNTSATAATGASL